MNSPLQEVLDKHGIDILVDEKQPYQRNAHQWLFLNTLVFENKTIQYAYFGDFKNDIEDSWIGHVDTLSEIEIGIINQKIHAAREKHRAEKLKEQERIANEAQNFIDEECTQRATETPYTKRKGLSGLHGAYAYVNERNQHILIVPLKDINGKLWSYQRIYPEKLPSGTDKLMLKGGKKQGCFFEFKGNNTEEIIYVCEGWATGASVYEALEGNSTVLAAMDSGNLTHIGHGIRSSGYRGRIVFCADNDQFNRDNPGISAATAAALGSASDVVYPTFRDEHLKSKPTDFNDLHQLEGLNEVRRQILEFKENTDQNSTHEDSSTPGADERSKYYEDVDFDPIFKMVGKRIVKPTERAVSKRLLDFFGHNLLKQDHDLFLWRDTHWVLLGTNEKDLIKKKIGQLGGETYSSKDIEGAFRYFLLHCPPVPFDINLFSPNKFVSNYKNGTLFLTRMPDGAYKTEFQNHHKREDYITYCLPYDYLPDSTEVNHEFISMLHRIWAGDPFVEDKIKALRMLFGACLCPAFSTIAYFVGGPGTGKSTLLKIIRRLVTSQNICSVDPTNFEGFNMDIMIGKLVNIDTDINTQKPINDEIVKKIIDQMEITIKRKYQKDVVSTFPSVHCFGGNAMPKTRDGASRAYPRRMLVFETNRFQPTGLYDKEFDQWVWDQSPQGILNFAHQGLKELCANRGHFHVIPGSIDLINAMQNKSDLIGQFLEEVKLGYIEDKNSTVFMAENCKIKPKELWNLYKEWFKEHHGNHPKWGKIEFYASVQGHGVEKRLTNGNEYFHGIGVNVAREASH